MTLGESFALLLAKYQTLIVQIRNKFVYKRANPLVFWDLLSHVRSIADFLNRPLTDDIISRIAEQSSFSAMKKDRDSVLTVPFRDGRNVPILRKGVVGDWKNYFTPELNERFEKEVLAKLQGSGLEFDFEI